ncbi:hypothetical protein [Paenibacillus sp. Soil766]|nr:hypothetical protein [Paenibacillus sp. Soil766]
MEKPVTTGFSFFVSDILSSNNWSLSRKKRLGTIGYVQGIKI